jgi:pimeloyl-ACP methyl ester carboxylesterase
MKNGHARKRPWAFVISLIAIAVVVLAVLPFIAMVVLYENTFGKRINAPENIAHTVEEFDGLMRTRHTFVSDKGQEIVGYLYKRDGVQYKGAAVLAHGFGSGGHCSYLAAVDYLVKNGYMTFAYDVTGNDESGGKSVRGLPQGVIDLNNAITYAEGLDEFRELPVVLFGHSWGGYSVSNVLRYHPEVRAAAVLSGFNRSTDLVESYARKMFGDSVKYLMPYEGLYERLKFGEYASNTALESFGRSSMPVMVVQGSADNVVPAEYGYDKWYDVYGDSERFTFLWVEGKGHGDVLFDNAPSRQAVPAEAGEAGQEALEASQAAVQTEQGPAEALEPAQTETAQEGEGQDGTKKQENALLNVLTNNRPSRTGEAKRLSSIYEEVGSKVIEFFDRYCVK